MKKRILSLLLCIVMVFSLVGVASAAGDETFSDVKPGIWFYEYVEDVADLGYFIGYPDGTFQPNGDITRAEIVLVLARMAQRLGLARNYNLNAPIDESPFEDVPTNMWYSAAIKWAADEKITLGMGNNKFAPQAAIAREDACTLICRFIDYVGENKGEYYTKHYDASLISEFVDEDQIRDYAAEAVDVCMAYGIIEGFPDGTFQPRGYWTRAQGAKMISLLHDVLDVPDEPYIPPYNPPAEESVDVKTARELNALLSAHAPANFLEVVQILADAGYPVEQGIIPVAADHSFRWDEITNTVYLVKGEDTVIYPEGASNEGAEDWYDLALTPYYINNTDKEIVFEFGGTLVLTEDLYLTDHQEGISGDAVIDLNGYKLVINCNQFNMFANVTIKNGTIHIVGRRCSFGIPAGSLTLENLEFEVDAGLTLSIHPDTIVDGNKITVDVIKDMCVIDYDVKTEIDGYICISGMDVDPADIQTARELNAIVEAESPANFLEVINALEAAGYPVEDGIVPVTENYRFCWDETTNTVLLVKGEDTVIYPQDASNANAESWYDLAWTLYYVNNTEQESVFEFGGTFTLTEDLVLTNHQEGIHGDASIDLNGHKLVIYCNQFNMFADVTIKNGTIKVIGRNCSIGLPEGGTLNLVNVKFEVGAGLRLDLRPAICVNGSKISVATVEDMCVGNYEVNELYFNNNLEFIMVQN